MDISQDHFALFGLPRRYALDEAQLSSLYHVLSAQVHPDKFAHLSEAEQRLAMQRTTRVNEAYQTLRQPLARAKYLLGLAGIDVDQGREMSGEFLMQQMEWREMVADARAASDVARLEDFLQQLQRDVAKEYAKLAQQLQTYPDAAAASVKLVRQLMFQEKLLHDIDEALTAAEA